jgi:hypothetical protein
MQNRKLTASFIALTTLLIAPSIWADLKSDVSACQQVADNTKRLACFDQIALAEPRADLNTVSATKTATASIEAAEKEQSPSSTKIEAATPVKLAQTPIAKVPAVEPSSAPTVVSKQNNTKADSISPLDAFGQSEKVGVESITSNLIGKFSGWKKGQKLKLENGQVWLVVRQKSGYLKVTNPKITISRGSLGSFDAKVEGLNARAKVRRLK